MRIPAAINGLCRGLWKRAKCARLRRASAPRGEEKTCTRPLRMAGRPACAAPPEPAQPEYLDLVSAMLSLAAPLTDATFSEIHLGLYDCDHALLQRLRRWPAVSPLSDAEGILLGASVPPDEVDFENVRLWRGYRCPCSSGGCEY